MKFLFIDTYYPRFLQSFHRQHPELSKASFDDHRQTLLGQAFGTSDFYSYNLTQLGHKAEDFILNDYILQHQWAAEHQLPVAKSRLMARLQTLPLAHRIIGRPGWIQTIALAQIQNYRPDVVYCQDLTVLNPDTLQTVKQHCRLLVGQIASPLPPPHYLTQFDLIVTSFPHFVGELKTLGVASQYLKLGFEPRVWRQVGTMERTFGVAFIGSYSYYHKGGTQLLESVAAQTPIEFWGQGTSRLAPSSAIRQRFHGEAWGLAMYKILAQTRIAINRHIGVAGEYANNMRLYETTGMGAMLLTDEKKNLGDLFKVGEEVVTYTNDQDLVDKIRYYLDHETERQAIALAGQKRTLAEHSYDNRMKELVHIIEQYV